MLTLCYDFSGIGSSKPPANPMKKIPLCAHCAGEEPRHSTRKSTGLAVLKASGVGDPVSPGSVLLLWLPLQQLPLPSAPATRAILPPPHSCVYPSRSSTGNTPRTPAPKVISSLSLSWRCPLPSPSHLPRQKGSFCRFLVPQF